MREVLRYITTLFVVRNHREFECKSKIVVQLIVYRVPTFGLKMHQKLFVVQASRGPTEGALSTPPHLLA